MEELFYPFKESLKSFEEMNFMISSLHVFPHDFEELKIEVFDFQIFLKFLMHKISIIFIFLMVISTLVLRFFMLLRLIFFLGFHWDEIMYMKSHEAIMNMKVDES